VVCTASSSVRLWTTLARDFTDVAVLNRGFGGSQVRDAVHYADQIAIHYRPRAIVIYAGDNDIAAGRTPQQVLGDVRAFVARIRRDLPDTPIAYISIKPSPSRVEQIDAQRTANALVKAKLRRLTNVDYIDVSTPMLDATGRPRLELFGPDRLHMNDAGYALWCGIVAQHLQRILPRR
ncbi:MAG: SGNH/GDSL hydrolase family protein, partial [Luteimonas sp.]